MAYQKHNWRDGELITPERLNAIEDEIKKRDTEHTALAIEVQKKIYTPSLEGEEGDVLCWKGPKQTKWGKKTKLENQNELIVESATTQDIATAFNNLVADLKAKNYMNEV